MPVVYYATVGEYREITVENNGRRVNIRLDGNSHGSGTLEYRIGDGSSNWKKMEPSLVLKVEAGRSIEKFDESVRHWEEALKRETLNL